MYKITVQNERTGETQEIECISAAIQTLPAPQEPIRAMVFNDSDDGALALISMGYYACVSTYAYLEEHRKQQAAATATEAEGDANAEASVETN